MQLMGLGQQTNNSAPPQGSQMPQVTDYDMNNLAALNQLSANGSIGNTSIVLTLGKMAEFSATRGDYP
jgi:hypothetical protein